MIVMNDESGEIWSWPGFSLREEDIKIVDPVTKIRLRYLHNVL
jgi:hypothetical protein